MLFTIAAHFDERLWLISWKALSLVHCRPLLASLFRTLPILELRLLIKHVVCRSMNSWISLILNVIVLLLLLYIAHCLPQETGKISIKGEMAWKMTLIGQNSTFVKCPYGPSTFSATRFCGGNFSAGGLWSKPDASSCKYKSDRTNKLDKIAKVRKAWLHYWSVYMQCGQIKNMFVYMKDIKWPRTGRYEMSEIFFI